MNIQRENACLDGLLADSATIADCGFSASIHQQLRQSKTTRTKIFAMTTVCWLVLAVIFTTPQSIADFFAYRVSIIASLDALINQLPPANFSTSQAYLAYSCPCYWRCSPSLVFS
ncbi:MAG: hypothetical protein IIC60_10365 [Proteobacteria bacterium]|nr:hypothetical protein [Pseudomonadota bacterium]